MISRRYYLGDKDQPGKESPDMKTKKEPREDVKTVISVLGSKANHSERFLKGDDKSIILPWDQETLQIWKRKGISK